MNFFNFLFPWWRDTFSFPYQRAISSMGSYPVPMVSLLIKDGQQEQKVRFLVDSGADVTSFPVEYAEVLGIELDKRKKTRIIGVGNNSVSAYPSKVQMKLGRKWYVIQCFFVENAFMPLLGRVDVWKHFSIEFDNSNRKVVFRKV